MNREKPEGMSAEEWAQERRRIMRGYISIEDIAKALREPGNRPAQYYLDRIAGLRTAVSRQRGKEDDQ